ncbi:unnamed protein product [Sphenostylis stenocarpa]|uniref:Uncharacterized protein n=1 Tax=Sphenostylis stenocarpa TaxID=92480 RepID=A0AA86VHG6_9FABA|nr:unnamed protein product [Sphenostylis stenocarpa]
MEDPNEGVLGCPLFPAFAQKLGAMGMPTWGGVTWVSRCYCRRLVNWVLPTSDVLWGCSHGWGLHDWLHCCDRSVWGPGGILFCCMVALGGYGLHENREWFSGLTLQSGAM